MIVFIVLILGVLFASIIDKSSKKLAFFLVSFLFIAVMGCRNDITSDYGNYEMLYKEIWLEYNEFGFLGMFGIHLATDQLEPGFTLLSLLVYWLSGGSYRIFLIITAIIIIVPLFKFYSRFSNLYYTIALYLMVGTYFDGFNVLRQMIAASIAIISFQYIYKQKFFKFLGVIILSALFHITAVVMIPAYFLFQQRHTNRLFFRIEYVIIGIFLYINTAIFSQFFLDIAHGGFYDYEQGMTAISITNFLFPLALLLSCEIIKLMFPNRYDDITMQGSQPSSMLVSYSIIESGMYMWVIMAACMTQIPMIDRFASFFAPFAMVYISESLSGIKKKSLRNIIQGAYILVLVAYQLIALSSSYLNDYAFTVGK